MPKSRPTEEDRRQAGEERPADQGGEAEERRDASSLFNVPPLPAQKDSDRRTASQEPAGGVREVRHGPDAEERQAAS
eukprot:10838579-Alexandrium_andersonii.AAC.1